MGQEQRGFQGQRGGAICWRKSQGDLVNRAGWDGHSLDNGPLFSWLLGHPTLQLSSPVYLQSGVGGMVASDGLPPPGGAQRRARVCRLFGPREGSSCCQFMSGPPRPVPAQHQSPANTVRQTKVSLVKNGTQLPKCSFKIRHLTES